jgi:Fe-S-cluster containining protein
VVHFSGGCYPSSDVSAPRRSPWKTDPARASLLARYAEVDALLRDFTCDDTAECCQFAITGREPYPTAIELSEVRHAIAAAGIAIAPAERARETGGRRKRSLPLIEETGRCPLLGDDMRCRIYSSRPFGCRTFFCDRARGPGKMPRVEIQRISRAIADLSSLHAPRDPHPRPLRNALEEMRQRGGR